MPFSYKILAQGQSTSSSVATFNTIYTVPSGKQVIIKTIRLADYTAADGIAYTIRIVPSGATAGNSHVWVTEPATGALRAGSGDAVSYSDTITLNAGDFIQLSTGTANVVNYFIFGVEIS